MTIALLIRRWSIPVIGATFLLVGLVVLYAHVTFTGEWVAYAQRSDMAFYPGLPSTRASFVNGPTLNSAERYASLAGQILIALGVTLLAGWIGFTLGHHSLPARKRQLS